MENLHKKIRALSSESNQEVIRLSFIMTRVVNRESSVLDNYLNE